MRPTCRPRKPDVADARALHVGDRRDAAPPRELARDDRLLGAGVEHELRWARRR